MSNAANEIRKMARKAADEKIAAEKEKLEKSVNDDLEVIERILKLVKTGLIYKEIRTNSRTKYVVVTEEMVMADYTNKGDGYRYGTSIKRVARSAWNYEHTVITVNAHTYYHAADIFVKYRYNIENSIEKTQLELDALQKRRDNLDQLERLEPAVKQIMLDYQNSDLGKAELER